MKVHSSAIVLAAFILVTNGASFSQNVPAVTASANSLPWDVNGDGVVDIADLMFVGKHLGGTAREADVNSDGLVNIADLRVASRGYILPTLTGLNVGFRCVSQHFSIFNAGVRKPDHLAERVSRSPDGVPVLGIIVQPNTKPVPGRLVGDESWPGTFEDRTLM